MSIARQYVSRPGLYPAGFGNRSGQRLFKRKPSWSVLLADNKQFPYMKLLAISDDITYRMNSRMGTNFLLMQIDFYEKVYMDVFYIILGLAFFGLSYGISQTYNLSGIGVAMVWAYIVEKGQRNFLLTCAELSNMLSDN
jgi:hypothetical protein